MPSARRPWLHKVEIGHAERQSPRFRAGPCRSGKCSLALADHALTPLFNNCRTTASCGLLAHLDGAHPLLGFYPYAEARTADDDASVRCRTLLDNPTTLRRWFLDDVKVSQRRGNDCRQPNTNHQRLHVSLLVGSTELPTSSV